MNINLDHAIISVDATTVQNQMMDGSIILVDVRETSEYEQEHIPGALLLPMSSFDPELFPKIASKTIVLHCAVGKRSEAAGKMLLKAGHENVVHLQGGMNAWKNAGFEIEEQFIPPAMPELTADANTITSWNSIDNMHPGQILEGEFMQPMKLSAIGLSAAVGIDVETINSIIVGLAAVDAEISLRFARYFCTDDDFWLRLQLSYDMQLASQSIGLFVQDDIKPRLCA